MRRLICVVFGWVFPVAAIMLFLASLVTGLQAWPVFASFLMGCGLAYRLGEAEGLEQRRRSLEELREQVEALRDGRA